MTQPPTRCHLDCSQSVARKPERINDNRKTAPVHTRPVDAHTHTQRQIIAKMELSFHPVFTLQSEKVTGHRLSSVQSELQFQKEQQLRFSPIVFKLRVALYPNKSKETDHDSSDQIFGIRRPKLFYFPIRNFSLMSSELFPCYVYRDIIKKKKESLEG